MASHQDEGIEYTGDEHKRPYALRVVDLALKKNGNLGVYGDLSQGLEGLRHDGLRVNIEECDGYFRVSVFPDRPTGGHDFSFKVDPTTAALTLVCVGDIIAPPG